MKKLLLMGFFISVLVSCHNDQNQQSSFKGEEEMQLEIKKTNQAVVDRVYQSILNCKAAGKLDSVKKLCNFLIKIHPTYDKADSAKKILKEIP